MIGLYVDTNNLYHNVKRKYDAKIDYAKYISFIEDLGDIAYKKAYCVNDKTFGHSLTEKGFEVSYLPKWHKTQHVKMTFEILQNATDACVNKTEIDTVVIGSSNNELTFLMDRLVDRGVKVIIVAANIPDYIPHRKIEIPPSLLEEPQYGTPISERS